MGATEGWNSSAGGKRGQCLLLDLFFCVKTRVSSEAEVNRESERDSLGLGFHSHFDGEL